MVDHVSKNLKVLNPVVRLLKYLMQQFGEIVLSKSGGDIVVEACVNGSLQTISLEVDVVVLDFMV